MSHVSTVACEIRDLEALRAAAEKFGAQLLYGQTSFTYYHQKAPCLHAINLPGVSDQIGLRLKEANDPTTFTLNCDFYSGGLEKKFGPQLEGLRNEYLAVIAERELAKGGYRVTRQQEDNRTVLYAYA